MIVLDTAALALWLSGHGGLSAAARNAIERELEIGEIAISVISVLDVAEYVEDGRLELSVSMRGWLSSLASIEGVRIVPIDVSIAVRATNLPSVLTSHQKIIAATSISLGGPLITPDPRLREFAYAGAIW